MTIQSEGERFEVEEALERYFRSAGFPPAVAAALARPLLLELAHAWPADLELCERCETLEGDELATERLASALNRATPPHVRGAAYCDG